MVQHLDVPALKKQWVLDAQWTDCPPEVEQVVSDLWRLHELGNDNYMLRRSISNLLENYSAFKAERFVWGLTPEEQKGWVEEDSSALPLVDYLRSKGIADDEEVIIHWWW